MTTVNTSHRVLRWFYIAGLVCAVTAGVLQSTANAQRMRGRMMPGLMPAFAAPRFNVEPNSDAEDFSGAATLETDPEVERLLRRAEQYVQDQRYDLAVVLAQKVLDGPASLLIQRKDEDYQWYTSTQSAVEQLLAKLPKSALAMYRLTADAEARGLLAAEGDARENALAEIVRRYFISSFGDDAAFELGCRLMDRHDFVGASRMFERILADHPDADIARDQVLLRQVVANARLGDAKQAQLLLAKINALASRKTSAEVLQLVRQDVTSSKAAPRLANVENQAWPMRLGSPARDGVMPSLEDPVLKGPLIADARWKTKDSAIPRQAQPSMQQANMIFRGAGMRMIVGGSGQVVREEPILTNRSSIVETWEKKKLMPVGAPILHQARIYLKTHSAKKPRENRPEDFVSSYSTETGELAFETRPAPAQVDVTGQLFALYGMQSASGDRPSTFEEVMLFGDRTTQLVSIIDGVIYVVEGCYGEPTADAEQQMIMRAGMPVSGSTQTRLSAFWDPSNTEEPSEGKMRWTDEGNPWMANVRFVSAAVPCAGKIVLAGREGSSLHLYAVSPKDGSLVWKTFLCDEPRGGVSRWSPVGLAVEGDEVYVSSGCGVVFTLDGSSGGIRWAVQYKRSGSPIQSAQFQVRQLAAMSIKGWDEDTVIPRGRALLVMPSDAERIFAFDRRTGSFLWESPKDTPDPDGGAARYPLGVYGDSLFVAGNNVVRRIKVQGGSIVWEQKLDSSLGRGILTRDAIYLPDKESIVQLGLEKGERLAQVGVTLPDHDPVGNLICDGRRLYCLGLDRLHALSYKHAAQVSADGSAAQAEDVQAGNVQPAAAENRSPEVTGTEDSTQDSAARQSETSSNETPNVEAFSNSLDDQ